MNLDDDDRRRKMMRLNNSGMPLAQMLRDGSAFYAPRTSSITQTRGSGTPTITRATVATVTNNDGYQVTALSGELRQQGARRVRNLLNGSTHTFTGGGWNVATGPMTVSAPGVAAPDDTLTACTITAAGANAYLYNPCTGTISAGNTGLGHIWIRRRTGTGTVSLLRPDNTLIDITGTLTTSWAQFSAARTVSIGNCYIGVVIATSGDAVDVWHPQTEDVTPQTTQTAGEYVSVGVLSAPYHGAGVDGVKYFNTDISGNPIPAATLDGSVVEAAATQYLGDTATPATQTTASLGTGTYTLWCEGTGSCIASAGTATITGAAAASVDAPDQFEVTVAGTVTVTVTGSLTKFNLTNTPYQTSYIVNTGAAGTSTTRNKDVLDDQVASNLTAAAGSVAFQWTPSHAPSGTIALCGSYVDASNYTVLLHDGTKYIFRKRIAGVNYDTELTASFVSGTTYDIALRWGASGSNLAVDGVLGTANADTTAAQLGTRWQWGADGNGGQQAGACFKEKFMMPRAMSDNELRAFTA